MLSMYLACWTVRAAAVRAHLRLVDTHSGFCCLAALCIGGVLHYLLFNSSNLNYLDCLIFLILYSCFDCCLFVCPILSVCLFVLFDCKNFIY